MGGGDVSQSIADSFEARVLADGGVYEAETCLLDQITTFRARNVYDIASLILIPSGYKESKLYSLKPVSGAGDFAYTRNGTSTRKGPSLVEEVPYNRQIQSQTFESVSWSKFSLTVTGNNTLAPDGTMTGDLVTESAGSAFHGMFAAHIRVSGSVTNTVYLKAGTRRYVAIRSVGSAVGFGAVIDTLNWTATTGNDAGGAAVTVTFSDAANGWKKIVIKSSTTENGTGNMLVCGQDTSTWTFSGGSSSGSGTWYIWGAQTVLGTTELDYFCTTNRFNVPKLDYTGSSCPSILLEPARTNLALRSEEFDNVTWVKDGSTASANTTTAPDGLSTADSILETVANSLHQVYQLFTKAASAITYTWTIYVKPNGRTWINIVAANGGNNVNRYFDLTGGGALGNSSATGFTLVNSEISLSSNGFYKCTITFTTDATTGLAVSTQVATANGTNTYAGDITKGFYAWGAQLEQASYATSYIPTTSATVARVADAIPTLSGVSSLIGQTEGTIYAEGYVFDSSTDNMILNLTDGTLNNRIIFYVSSGFLTTQTIVGGVNQGFTQGGVIANRTVFKVALVYQSGYNAIVLNGVKTGQDLTYSPPVSMSQMRFESGAGTGVYYGGIKSLVVFPTALSDADLITLTTP